MTAQIHLHILSFLYGQPRHEPDHVGFSRFISALNFISCQEINLSISQYATFNEAKVTQ